MLQGGGGVKFATESSANLNCDTSLSVPVALGMDGSFLKGRCISVMPKRTHNPRVFAELNGQGKSHGRSSFAGFGGGGRKKNSFFY